MALSNFKIGDIKKRMFQGATGRIMNNFMFIMNIPTIPALTEFFPVKGIMAGIPLTYSVRSTSIPSLEREIHKVKLGRTMPNNISNIYGVPSDQVLSNKQYEYTLPKPSNASHVWNVKMFLTELGVEYSFLYEWFLSMDSAAYSFDSLTTDATVTLFGINETPLRSFKLLGIYPTAIPGIESLNYDSSDEFIELNCSFAYDHIYYDDAPLVNQFV